MITPVTPKVDLPASASRGNERTEASDKHPRTVRTQSESANPATTSADRVRLEKAVGKIRDVLRRSDSRLQFEIDQDLQRVVVKIVNGDSGEVIRQIPAEEVLDLERNLAEQKGLLLEERV